MNFQRFWEMRRLKAALKRPQSRRFATDGRPAKGLTKGARAVLRTSTRRIGVGKPGRHFALPGNLHLGGIGI